MKKVDGELDSLDRQLLYWLDLNCCESLSVLARKMNTTPAKISYRMSHLVKNKAIHSFITLIDYRKLGLRGYAAYFKLKEMSREDLRKLVDKIRFAPNIVDLLLTTGAYDMQIVFLVESSDEAAEGLWSVREQLERYIIEERILVNLRSQFFSRDSFLEKTEPKDIKPRLVLDTPTEKINIDDTDDAILSVIAHNADWPLWKIAKNAKVAGPTVYNRIKKLEKNKIIVGYTAKMNPNLRGYYLYRVLVKLRYIPLKRREEFIGFLDRHPLIYRSSFTFGIFDLTYDARVSGDTQLRDLLRQVYDKFKVEVIRQDWMRVHEIIKFGFYTDNKK